MIALIFASVYWVRLSSKGEEEELNRYKVDEFKPKKERKNFFNELAKIKGDNELSTDEHYVSLQKAVMGESTFDIDQAMEDAIDKEQSNESKNSSVILRMWEKFRSQDEDEELTYRDFDFDSAIAVAQSKDIKTSELSFWDKRKQSQAQKEVINNVEKLLAIRDFDELYIYLATHEVPTKALNLIREEVPFFVEDNPELFDLDKDDVIKELIQ